MRLEGKVALISGGARGMGVAEARLFAKEGAIGYVLEAQGKELEAEINASGGGALFVRLDVTQADSWSWAIEATMSRFGKLDVLVNNAAIFATIPMNRGGIETIDLAEWDRLIAVNLKGPFLCARAVLPTMRARKSGKIINIGSGTALVGPPGRIHYVASKDRGILEARIGLNIERWSLDLGQARSRIPGSQGITDPHMPAPVAVPTTFCSSQF